MNYDDARLALEIMDRYDARHWDILELRAFAARPANKQVWREGDAIDQARFRVSQFFKSLTQLEDGGFITKDFTTKIVSKEARLLCQRLLEPLNATIRSRNHAAPTGQQRPQKKGQTKKA